MFFVFSREFVTLRLRLFLGQHHNGIHKVCDPALGKAQAARILTHGNHGLHYPRLSEVILIIYAVDRFLRHLIKSFLEKARKAELELHQVTHEHHEVLGESLELHKVNLHVLELMATAADALVNLLEEVIAHGIHILKHLLASCLLANTQAVVYRRDMERGLEQLICYISNFAHSAHQNTALHTMQHGGVNMAGFLF